MFSRRCPPNTAGPLSSGLSLPEERGSPLGDDAAGVLIGIILIVRSAGRRTRPGKVGCPDVGETGFSWVFRRFHTLERAFLETKRFRLRKAAGLSMVRRGLSPSISVANHGSFSTRRESCVSRELTDTSVTPDIPPLQQGMHR